MRNATSLIRIRFPYDLVDSLDRLAERLRVKNRRKIPRAALVRALVQIHMSKADEDRQEFTDTLGADPVKRGREKGQSNGEGQVAEKLNERRRRRHPLIRAGEGSW